jgi:hypothetical protein
VNNQNWNNHSDRGALGDEVVAWWRAELWRFGDRLWG